MRLFRCFSALATPIRRAFHPSSLPSCAVSTDDDNVARAEQPHRPEDRNEPLGRNNQARWTIAIGGGLAALVWGAMERTGGELAGIGIDLLRTLLG